MRLSKHDIDGIRAAVGEILAGIPGKLYLYGSRARDHLRGGDIDLCYVADDSVDVSAHQAKVIDVVMGITRRLGEQKIDFSLISTAQSSAEPFWSASLVGAVEIALDVSA